VFEQVISSVRQIAYRAVSLAVAFITVSIVAKSLGLGGYGAYAFSTSVVGLFAIFFDMGMNTAASKYLALSTALAPKLLRYSLSISSIAVILLAPSFYLVFCVWGKLSPRVSVLLLAYFGFFSIANRAIPFLLVRGYSLSLAQADVIAASAGFLYVLLVSSSGGLTLENALTAMLISALGRFMTLWVTLLVKRKDFDWAPENAGELSLKTFILSASKPAFGEALGVIHSRADIVTLGLASTLPQVALYGLAYRCASLLMIVPSSTSNIFLASLNSAALKSKDALSFLVKRSAEVTLGLLLPVSTAIAVFSPVILNTVGGRSFTGGSLSLSLLSIAFAVYCFRLPLSSALIADSKFRINNLLASYLYSVLCLERKAPRLDF
jgi:O-antigen/teichoic acid export membrane protein